MQDIHSVNRPISLGPGNDKDDVSLKKTKEIRHNKTMTTKPASSLSREFQANISRPDRRQTMRNVIHFNLFAIIHQEITI